MCFVSELSGSSWTPAALVMRRAVVVLGVDFYSPVCVAGGPVLSDVVMVGYANNKAGQWRRRCRLKITVIPISVDEMQRMSGVSLPK